MAIFATDSSRLSTVVKFELVPNQGYCRDLVTVNEAAALTYKVGTVLGKITATGKYIRCEASAADGSQVAAAVYIGDVNGNAGDLAVAATTDTKVLVLTRGPAIVAASALVAGASVTAGALTTTMYNQLKALGIIPETAV